MGVEVGDGRRRSGAVTVETPAMMDHSSNAVAFRGIVEGETPAVMGHGSGSDDRLRAADGCIGGWEREEEKRLNRRKRRERRVSWGMKGMRGLRREMEEGREWGTGPSTALRAQFLLGLA